MKKLFNTENARRAAALLLTLILLTAGIPAAMADTPSLSNTRWYATGFNISLFSGLIDAKSRDLMNALSFLLQFVPDESLLEWPSSLMSICITIDFRPDGTYQLSTLASELGQIDDSSRSTDFGTWSIVGNTVVMRSGGSPVPLVYQDSKLTLAIFGLGFDFARV